MPDERESAEPRSRARGRSPRCPRARRGSRSPRGTARSPARARHRGRARTRPRCRAGPSARRPAGGSRRPSRPCAPATMIVADRPGCRNGSCAGLEAPVRAERGPSVPRARPWPRRSRPPAGDRRASSADARSRSGPRRRGRARAGARPGSVGRYTAPASNRRTVPTPRARLCRATSSSEPSSVVRSSDRSVESGLASVTARRSGCSAPRRSRSARSGWAKLQPTISFSPWAASASAARRRRRCRAVRRPDAPWREGSVTGSLSSPSSRATSSIRSTSRVTSARRNAGTVTSRPSWARAAVNPSALRISALRSRGMSTPSRRR